MPDYVIRRSQGDRTSWTATLANSDYLCETNDDLGHLIETLHRRNRGEGYKITVDVNPEAERLAAEVRTKRATGVLTARAKFLRQELRFVKRELDAMKE